MSAFFPGRFHMLLEKKVKYRLDNYAKLYHLNYPRNIIKFPIERIQKL